jgi:hypothetical protein
MVDHLEEMPVDLTEAFGQAVSTLIAWKDGEEPAVNVHGRPTPISAIAGLVETYKGTMPAKLYWPLVRHANRSPEHRTEAFKLAEDSSYETGARCLLQWIRNNESKFWQNEAFRDDLGRQPVAGDTSPSRNGIRRGKRDGIAQRGGLTGVVSSRFVQLTAVDCTVRA